MSKSRERGWVGQVPDHDPVDDRIPPTYEESIAASRSRPSPATRQQTSSTTSMVRQERTRRIFELVTTTIIPCFTSHLCNACNNLTIVVLPANALQTSGAVTEQNIVSPSLPSHETTASLIQLAGLENRSSFWAQFVVVQELDQMLRKELSNTAPPTDTGAEVPDSKSQSSSQSVAPFQVQPSPESTLPPRPGKRSWLKKTFVLPGPDHDPTGETGKWNLGWRSPENPEEGAGSDSSLWRPRAKTKTLQTDEVAVHARLQDVSFRTESEMGLLETTTVKCIWLEIQVGI